MTRRELIRGLAVGAAGGVLAGLGRRRTEGQTMADGAGYLKVVRKGTVYDAGPGIISGVCRCANGDLLVAFNTSGDSSPSQRIGTVRSTDGGLTWGAPERWFDTVFRDGGVEAGCTLTCLSTGRVLLPYADCIYLHPGVKDNYDRLGLLFCPYSDDNGKTWKGTKAQRYDGLEGFAYSKVVELPGGELLMPLWGARDVRPKYYSGVLRSRDGGETWSDYHAIGTDYGDEVSILLLPDKRVLALIRGYAKVPDHAFHISWSEDGGRSWSAPQKAEMKGTSPALHLTPKERLLAGYRSILEGGRCHISSSPDGGKTWQFELEVELPRGAWRAGGYPSFVNLADGRIMVTFHNHPGPSWYTFCNILEEA